MFRDFCSCDDVVRSTSSLGGADALCFLRLRGHRHDLDDGGEIHGGTGAQHLGGTVDDMPWLDVLRFRHLLHVVAAAYVSSMNSTGHYYKQSIRRGALFLIGSSVVFSLVGALVKTLTSQLPVEMVVFFRNAAGFIFLIPWMLTQRSQSLKTTRIWDHTARAVSGVLAMYCFFYAIANLHLAEAISLNFTSPLIIPLIAFVVLKERVPANLVGLLAIGFIGVLLIVKPGVGVFKPAAVMGIISAFFAAFALVNIRKLTTTEPAMRVVFYFAVIASTITLIPMLRVWQSPDQIQWIMLVAIGLLATLGQWLLTRGYASGPVGQVGIFHYSAVIFAGLLDWLIWKDRPDAISLIGVALICAAGIVSMRRSKTPLPEEKL